LPFCFVSINKNNNIYSKDKVIMVAQLLAAAARGAGSAAQLAIRASPYVQTAIVGAVAVGGAFAIADAASLYNNRRNMAGQYQEQHEFPNDLTGITPFYMSFLFQTYEKRAIKDSPFLRSEGTIRLPIPDALKDTTSVTYNDQNLGQTVGAGLEAAAGSSPTTGTIDTLFNVGAAALTGAAVQASAQLAGGEFRSGISAYNGITLNPYQTVLFEKPNFKTHSFTWKLVPKNHEESITIRNIIRTFQYHMLPGVSDGVGLFFSFPSMVTVSLFPSSEFLYRFKPCVIDNVSVNYSPGISPSFYRGTNAAPTAITITINLKEIEYFTNKDYIGNSFDDTVAESNQTIRDTNQRNQQANYGAQFSPTNLP
jgi:Tail-tube assembly protein